MRPATITAACVGALTAIALTVMTFDLRPRAWILALVSPPTPAPLPTAPATRIQTTRSSTRVATPAPAITPTPGATWTPLVASSHPYLCRGGPRQGLACGVDSQCPGGICTQLAHPRGCGYVQRCAISRTICTDNVDCQSWPQVLGDYCVRTYNGTRNIGVACSSDTDCGYCEGGEWDGSGCSSDADCAGVPCNKTDGVCVNGFEQFQFQPRIGLAHDMLADRVVGPRMMEDDQHNAVTARSMGYPVGLGYDSANNDLWVADSANSTTRVEVFHAPFSNFMAASRFVGVPDSAHALTQLIPGDLNVGWWKQSPNTLSVWNSDRFNIAPVGDYAWITDARRIMRWPRLTADIGSVASSVLLQADLNGTDATGEAKGYPGAGAAKTRCINTTTVYGAPCTVDTDCGAGGLCRLSYAVADIGANKVKVWTDVENATAGQTPDIVLGSGVCAAGPTSMCAPQAVAFDGNANYWVADTANNRVLMFPRDAAAGTAAVLVIGQASFTTATASVSSTGLDHPRGLTLGSSNELLIADTNNSRVTYYPAPHGNGQAATEVFGQPSLTLNVAGVSSDGVLCDRLSHPSDVVFDGASNVWVADSGNGRVLQVPVTFTTGSAATIRLGQDACDTAHRHQVNAHSFGNGRAGGIVFFPNGATSGVCLADGENNRVLCHMDWNDPYTNPEHDAESILGQANATDWRANRGTGAASAASLWLPAGMGASSTDLYVADSGNNRVVDYLFAAAPNRLATAQDGLRFFCQPSSTSNSCQAVSASSCCNPQDAHADSEGNLWVASRDEGRLLFYCRVPGTARGFCTSANSNDTVADDVVGKTSLTAVRGSECTSPTAATLCMPQAVRHDVARHRVIVTDNSVGGCAAARLLVWGDRHPLAGMPATACIGTVDGTCTAYASFAGRCTGGTNDGTACDAQNEERLQGVASTQCPGGYCDWSYAPFCGVGSLAMHPTSDTLIVGKTGQLEYLGPLVTGMRANRAFGRDSEHRFSDHGTGYVAGQQNFGTGGLAFDPGGNLWAMQGTFEESLGGVYILNDPSPLRRPRHQRRQH